MSKKPNIMFIAICTSMLFAGCNEENDITNISNSANKSDTTSTSAPGSVSGNAELIIENGVVTGYSNVSGDIIISDGVTEINERAFELCNDITGVTIPEGVTAIGAGAFERCSKLERVTLPSTLTTLGDWTFSGCQLEEVILPDNVSTIYDTTFSSNRNIKISYKGKTYSESELELLCQSICYDKNGLFISEDGRLMDCFDSAEGTITVPNTVTVIDDGAFSQCDCINEIILPEGLTEIGDEAFRTCDALTTITIPESVTSIGASAFAYCEDISEITIPDGVTFMGEDVFASCDDISVVYKGIVYTYDNIDELYNIINE